MPNVCFWNTLIDPSFPLGTQKVIPQAINNRTSLSTWCVWQIFNCAINIAAPYSPMAFSLTCKKRIRVVPTANTYKKTIDFWSFTERLCGKQIKFQWSLHWIAANHTFWRVRDFHLTAAVSAYLKNEQNYEYKLFALLNLRTHLYTLERQQSTWVKNKRASLMYCVHWEYYQHLKYVWRKFNKDWNLHWIYKNQVSRREWIFARSRRLSQWCLLRQPKRGKQFICN